MAVYGLTGETHELEILSGTSSARAISQSVQTM